jgi:hypothetical protein
MLPNWNNGKDMFVDVTFVSPMTFPDYSAKQNGYCMDKAVENKLKNTEQHLEA